MAFLHPGRRLLLVLVWSGLVTLGGGLPAHAQLRTSWAAERLTAGQEANLFASWTGRDGFDAVAVELPEGWVLAGAQALRNGYGQQDLTVQSLTEPENGYLAVAPHPLRGPQDLILKVVVGEEAGRVEWRLTPAVRQQEESGARWMLQPGYEAAHTVLVEARAPLTENQALSFEEARAPVLLRRAGLPDLGTQAPYTIAFWMKGTGLNEVVLSTWDGDEEHTYPLEFVVGARGQLLFYQGQPGQHQSMTTKQPVADGRWHHVAVVHEPERGWLHLYLDGQAVDSLGSLVPLHVSLQTPLAIGARLPVPEAVPTPGGRFTGLLDELCLWPAARSSTTIRRDMRQPLQGPAEGAVHLGFEEAVPEALLERASTDGTRVRADLVFFYPVTHLRATVDSRDVHLSWETLDQQTRVFVVERSSEGRQFRAVHRVSTADGAPDVTTGATRFTFADHDAPGQVLYYRIRQQFENGAERVSGTIKLGMGSVASAAALDEPLLGNFPNPFNAATTITYRVQETQRVRVSVWDLAGQQVAMLVDDVKSPGVYEVTFGADDLPSGTYFVRLQTPEEVHSRKMTLMK